MTQRDDTSSPEKNGLNGKGDSSTSYSKNHHFIPCKLQYLAAMLHDNMPTFLSAWHSVVEM